MRYSPGKSVIIGAVLFASGLVFSADVDRTPLIRANQLRLSQRYEEAKQIYSSWLSSHVDDGDACFELGYTIYLQSCSESDPAAAASLRRKGREMGLRAEKLKCENPLLPLLLSSTNEHGADLRASYSPKPAVNELIKQAEAAYAKGQMDEALAGYQSALKLDPLAYKAALFSGDVFFSRQD